jgi:hypothetical protein
MEIRKKVLGYSLLPLFFCFYSTELLADNPDCTDTTVGLCTPSIIELIETDVLTESSSDSTGITEIETTTVTTTTTTTTNESSGDLLDSNNGFVPPKKDGSMDVDWGGQGSASMPTGSTCGDLGTDKCAEITGSGSSTSTMGVAGMGTTFIQTIDVQNLNMSDKGGRVNYTIKVHKQDNADSIYMHITGRDGTTTAFAGTDLLSAAGVATGYAEYTGGFDFGGKLTSIIVEIGGRDINLAIGPVFDDVSVTALWNIVNTIVSLHITTIETFIATGGYSDEIIDIAEDIFDHNDFDLDPNGEIEVQPNFEDDMSGEDSYESVELELDMPEMDMDIDMNMDMDITVDTGLDIGPPTNVEVTMESSIEMDIEIEMDMPNVDVEPIPVDAPPPEDIEVAADNMEDTDLPEVKDVSENETPSPDEEVQEPQPEPEEVVSEPEVVEEPEAKEEEPTKEEPKEEEKPEVKVAAKEEPKEKKEVAAKKEEKKEEPKQTKTQKKQDQKQKAGSKIVKNMGDKGRYDSTNQLKTLLVMQVLGNSKTFFNDQKLIQDTPGFFSDLIVPDTQISDNNFASFIMFGGSNVKMDALVDSQYNQ